MNDSIQQTLLSPEWLAWLSLPQTTVLGQDTQRKNFNRIIASMFQNLQFKKILTELLASRESNTEDNKEEDKDVKEKIFLTYSPTKKSYNNKVLIESI